MTRYIKLNILVNDATPLNCERGCPSLGNMDFCHAFQVYLVRNSDGTIRRESACIRAEVKP